MTADGMSEAGTEDNGGDATPAPPVREERITAVLPPPFAVADTSATEQPRAQDVKFLGPSAIFLPQLRLLGLQTGGVDDLATSGHRHNLSESSVESEADSDMHGTIMPRLPRMLGSQDFELEFVPRKAGFATVGGLRVVVVEDRVIEGEEAQGPERLVWLPEARTLKEWDVVAEVWVKSSRA